MFIAVLTKAQQFVFRPRWTDSMSSNPASLRSILIFRSTHTHVLWVASSFHVSNKNSARTVHLPMRATCSTHIIPLDSVILLIHGGDYKLRTSSLYGLLQFPAMSLLLGEPCSRRPSIGVLRSNKGTRFPTHTKQVHYSLIYDNLYVPT
jgi:hypothetical protein